MQPRVSPAICPWADLGLCSQSLLLVPAAAVAEPWQPQSLPWPHSASLQHHEELLFTPLPPSLLCASSPFWRGRFPSPCAAGGGVC